MPRKLKIISPSYFECRTILNMMKRFRDLALHNVPFVGYDEQASKPLSELIPGDIQGRRNEYLNLKKNIDLLIPSVKRYLSFAGIDTRVKSKGYVPGTMRIKEQEYDLVLNIFQLPHRLDAEIYDMLISTIDRGIGFYEIRKRKAFYELFNPLTWIAFIFRIPLIIIQRAGLSSDEEGASHILQFYKWVVRLVILLILILIAKMLGVAELFVSVFGFFK